MAEAEAKHAKHGRIRTQISYLGRMTSDRGGEETVTSTHSGWRGPTWRLSVQQTTQHNDVPQRAEKSEWCWETARPRAAREANTTRLDGAGKKPEAWSRTED